jgi:hypothetical protein
LKSDYKDAIANLEMQRSAFAKFTASRTQVIVSPEKSTLPSRKRKTKKPDTRTPEQIQAAKDRMAKARAGRKVVA